ncbi:hypothetical protein [Kitasatospora sp. NPDC093806]|uniref:hypothetical protein n=1 Tax=Kitasatospora sp. NPDC093806 TaxID=3155075 RepID=UPI00341C12EA
MVRRRRIWAEVAVCFAPLLALLVYGWLGIRMLEFDQLCSQEYYVPEYGRLLGVRSGWFPPDTVCEHARGTVSTAPAWALALFHGLLVTTAVAAVAVLRSRRARPVPGAVATPR